ncbi:ROK family transcriptional regulator [Pseudolysinimonas sp.]|uniref:ROK family transcriptional regulator n=1 Tax=Pseudolysinimonas sp. TaxID=2680009 RepID=UPI003F7D6F77
MPSGATGLDDVRRGNLAAVLRLVHREGPVSRAWITSRTGLNRSTVGGLVSDLASRGLVREAAPEATNRVGRPSPVVEADPRLAVVAVNPEVDAVTTAVVGLGARVERRERHELGHPATPEETARIAADAVAAAAANGARVHRIAAVGLAVPGLVGEADGTVRWAPHLGWSGAPLRALVEAATDLPAAVANDATAGALAEHLFGAGRGVDDLVYLNGGASGIGGGIIIGGATLGGHAGFAGELGQSPAAFLRPEDRTSERGVVEDEVGREPLLRALGMRSATDPELAAALLEGDREDIRAELARQRRVLAATLATAVNMLDPELIVLGGYLATLLESDPAELGRLVREHSVPSGGVGVRLATAGLGDDRLLVGAAELALAGVLADPGSISEVGR